MNDRTYTKVCDGRCTRGGKTYPIVQLVVPEGNITKSDCETACSAVETHCFGIEFGQIQCSHCTHKSDTCRLLLDLRRSISPTMNRFSDISGTIFSGKPECVVNTDPPKGGCSISSSIEADIPRGPPDCSGLSSAGWTQGRWNVDCWALEKVETPWYEIKSSVMEHYSKYTDGGERRDREGRDGSADKAELQAAVNASAESISNL